MQSSGQTSLNGEGWLAAARSAPTFLREKYQAMEISCRIYRCKKQPEMYLYLREDIEPDAETIPPELLSRTGVLEYAMELDLHPGRKLARVDVRRVLEALAEQGWFLQMPPPEQISGSLYFGD